ncbi:hypothetical protein NKH77_06875 [Streptomyces sp. M19]
MNLQQAVLKHRTLIVEGWDGVSTAGLLRVLARRHGFTLPAIPGELDHLDPTRPYREALLLPGLLALDGGLVGELVRGPLLRAAPGSPGSRRSTSPRPWPSATARSSTSSSPVPGPRTVGPAGAAAPDLAETEAAARAYEQAFATLAHHAPVVTLHAADRRRRARGRADRTGADRTGAARRARMRAAAPVRLDSR